jgi:hypothetical protein
MIVNTQLLWENSASINQLEAAMRNQLCRVYVVCFTMALTLPGSSITMAQDALEKFGENTFGAEKLKQYDNDLSRIGSQLQEREIETQQSSRVALTFLNLLRTAKSDREWSILASLRPNFDSAWKYLIQTGSLAGQKLQDSTFGNDLSYIYGQSRKIVDDPKAAAEYALGEAFAVGSYGRSAGELFRVWQLQKEIGRDDLKQLAEASASGIVEKVEKMETKNLPSCTDAMSDLAEGLSTVAGDIYVIVKKDMRLRSKIISFLSVPPGVSQFVEGAKKIQVCG